MAEPVRGVCRRDIGVSGRGQRRLGLGVFDAVAHEHEGADLRGHRAVGGRVTAGHDLVGIPAHELDVAAYCRALVEASRRDVVGVDVLDPAALEGW